MSTISIMNLTFCYDGSYDNIFENVSFQLDTDWKLGFTGRNGRGKTTFLKLLRGDFEYRGQIHASCHFDYFPFEVADPQDDAYDVVSRLSPGFEDWELYRELSLLDFSAELLFQPYATLSGGEKTKLQLAALFLKQDNFLLIDEPTNHLDAAGREKVSLYLQGKKGFILISHDRVFLDNCVDHILSINKADIEVQKGNFSSWWENKQRQDAFELAENEKLHREIKKLTVAARRTGEWSDRVEKTKLGEKKRDQGVKADKGHIGHMAAKMMTRSKAIEGRRERAVSDKEKLLKNIEQASELAVKPLRYHAEQLFALEDLSVLYGQRIVAGGTGFTINRGDRVLLSGKNGSGKSSILKLLAGEELESTGILRRGSGLVISYVPQDTSFMTGSLKEFTQKHDLPESLFLAILRKLDFERTQFEKDMRDFSGGQKKKALIAKSLCEKAHIYIWDEPLNFIDVISRMQIEDLLLAGQPTMIFVEHDAAFARKIATKTIKIV